MLQLVALAVDDLSPLGCYWYLSAWSFSLPAAMAQAQATIFADLIIELLGTPPTQVTWVEVRCDCLKIAYKPPVLPLCIDYVGCILSVRGKLGVKLRKCVYEWSDWYNVLYFGCPYWEQCLDFTTRLRRYEPQLQ